jgi:2-keto-4-pentenoate hydratase/2-oxohepta-3-ene-1,7-dioic acid hydratase in catechol pathway
MKLVRYGAAGKEKPGIIDSNGKIRDLSKIVKDINGEALSPAGLAKIKKANIDKLPKVAGNPRLGPCVARPSNFIAIGLNYADHAAEAGMKLPPEPIIFNKAVSCICGPNDNTITPKDSSKLDYEVELGGQWTKGKGCETFGPIGPWVATKDEIKDPQALNIWLKVNGEYRQKGNTKTMIFNVAEIVWWCSQYFIMEPGDIIVTGTPSGVALGMKPPKFLNVGDVVELGCDGLGTQKQKIVKARA